MCGAIWPIYNADTMSPGANLRYHGAMAPWGTRMFRCHRKDKKVRYKFKRRTPSDIYSHAGEELGAEYGVGI